MGGCHSLVCTRIISLRALRVGSGKASSLSNLPGLRRAGSRLSGRLVAPITMTWKKAGEGAYRTLRIESDISWGSIFFFATVVPVLLFRPRSPKVLQSSPAKPRTKTSILGWGVSHQKAKFASDPYSTFPMPQGYIKIKDPHSEITEQRYASYPTRIVVIASCLIKGVNPPRKLFGRPRLQGRGNRRNVLSPHRFFLLLPDPCCPDRP